MRVSVSLVALALCLNLVFAVISKDELAARKQFKQYVIKYDKPYLQNPVEYERRFGYFKENLLKLQEKQAKYPTATYGVDKFTDVSEQEFRSTVLMPPSTGEGLAISCLANGVIAPHMDTNAIPTSFDWRTKGVVTPVKDQGQCGSCWAFSTTGVMEAQYVLKGHQLTEFSEQQLVDCSTGCCMEEGQQVCNSGCGGGWQWNAYTDIMSWGGIETEDEYPYNANQNTCNMTSSELLAPMVNYTCLSTPNGADEKQMAAFLVANGPLAVAFNADLIMGYTSGIVVPSAGDCDPTTLDHAVLIVGYDVETNSTGSLPYWIVKNSWSNTWGEEGYFRIQRGNGACGINNAVSSVILK